MSAAEILKHLGSHGCKDVTNDLNLSKSSEYPITFGGFGDVYRGALHDGSRVAIKCIRLHLERTDDAKKHLKGAARELYVWSKCKHPNVLGLIGVAQYRNQIAMVSLWMEYGNFKKFMGLELPVDRYEMCAQISDSVAYLHQVGVVHGDIKGDNILISQDLTPKLTDFGSAGLREYTLQFSRTTSRANVSLNWAAPEMLDEDAKPTSAADVYSLGMTIFELITGSKPYANLNEHAVLTLVLRNEHPVQPEEFIPSNTIYGAHLWLLLTHCWACDPQDRPSSIDVYNEIRAIIMEKEKEDGQVGI